jgi:hypothetical protein
VEPQNTNVRSDPLSAHVPEAVWMPFLPALFRAVEAWRGSFDRGESTAGGEVLQEKTCQVKASTGMRVPCRHRMQRSVTNIS